MNDNAPESIVVLVGIQADGATYALDPRSRRRLEAKFPDVRQYPSVFVGFDNEEPGFWRDPEGKRRAVQRQHSPIWAQIVNLLTGISVESLGHEGPILLRFPASGDEIALESR